jgi:hypothetical protein
MKKKLRLIAPMLFIVSLTLAQSIPNNGFENWTTSSYQAPQYYFTSSMQHNGGYTTPVNAAQTTDSYHGTYAIKLNTVLVGTYTANAYFANGDPSHPIGQGIPISQKPTSMRLYYKCNVMVGDTALIILFFKAGGTVFNQNIQKIVGVKSAYTLLTIPLSLAVTPDSLIFGAVSSNTLGGGSFKGIPGSMLQIDSVSFTGISAQPTQMNGDFENWQTITSTTLQNWNVSSSGSNNVVRTTDSYAGTYALEMKTLGTNQANDTAYSTTASTGYSTQTGYAGGYSYTQTNDTLIFYYKYAPTNASDSAEIFLTFKKAGVNFHTQSQMYKAASSYVQAKMPFSLLQSPDTVIVSINSSKNWNVPMSYLGADLKIDNMYFKTQIGTSTIQSLTATGNQLNIYPNPAQNTFVVATTSAEKQTLQVFDVNGNLVLTQTINGTTVIDAGNLAQGIYNLSIINSTGVVNKRLVIVK